MNPRQPGDAAPPSHTVPPDHFEGLYAGSPDPWHFTSSAYERRKYAITLASLPRARYARVYEAGCSIGELTRLLAPLCDRLLAVDCSPFAVGRAAAATAAFPHVRVEQALLPAQLPDGSFDLIVLSELLYYFSGADLEMLLDGVWRRLEPGGEIVAVHCLTRGEGHVYDGFNVHAALVGRPGLTRLVHHDDEAFVLDVVRRT